LDAREIGFGQRRRGDPPTGQRLNDIAHRRVLERQRGLRLGAGGGCGKAGISAGWVFHGVAPWWAPKRHRGFVVSGGGGALRLWPEIMRTPWPPWPISKAPVAVSHSLTVIPARQYATLVGRERNQDTRHGVLKHRYDLYLRRSYARRARLAGADGRKVPAQRQEHRDVTILDSLPGVGRVVLATMLAESPAALHRPHPHAFPTFHPPPPFPTLPVP